MKARSAGTGRPDEWIIYAAYGSNLHPVRLAERCAAHFVTTGWLPAHRLVFCKKGKGPSGKCSIVPSDDPADRVFVAVYRMSAADKRALDAIEMTDMGYRDETVRVQTAGGPLAGLTYVVNDDLLEPGLLPFDWYKALVLVGARFHRFPAAYLEQIEATPAQCDPDAERASANWATVARAGRADNEMDVARG